MFVIYLFLQSLIISPDKHWYPLCISQYPPASQTEVVFPTPCTSKTNPSKNWTPSSTRRPWSGQRVFCVGAEYRAKPRFAFFFGTFSSKWCLGAPSRSAELVGPWGARKQRRFGQRVNIQRDRGGTNVCDLSILTEPYYITGQTLVPPVYQPIPTC